MTQLQRPNVPRSSVERQDGNAPVRTRPQSDALPGLLPDHDDAFFRHIVSGMRNGVLATTREGRLALINAEAYRIFGVSPHESDLGRPIADVLREHPEVVRVLTTVFDLHHLPNRVELRLRPSGKVIGYTLTLVRNDEDEVVGAAMFFKDLTRVEQLEERERLRDRLAAVGEMAAAIAHEVKNPLAGIEVMAGLLRRQVPDSRNAQSLLADIISEAKLANAIVVEMLEFVRPIRLQVERTDLGDVLHQAVTLAESKVARGGVTVDLDVAPGLPVIHGDHHQLCQVFTNLLTNAFEALDGKGRIAIKAATETLEHDPAFASDAQAPTPAIIVEVTDTGPGVSPEMTDRIFDPFFTTKPQGSGLGLPIVRKIVDAHDGRIDLTSTPGQGTRFRVTLPLSSGTTWFK
jgi:PAS domain S-box-containing protein